MKIGLKLLTLIAAVAMIGSAYGQGRMMMGGAGGGSASMLLFTQDMMNPSIRGDVAAELKLTDKQKDDLMTMNQNARSKMMEMFQSGQRPEREQMMEMFRKMQEDAEKRTKEILDAGQFKRLNELHIQRQGNNALLNEKTQKDLKLTEKQIARIKELQTKQREAMTAVSERMRNQEIQREEAMEIFQKNGKVMSDELGKVLTAEQTAALKAMGGAPFKFDDAN
jgi:Spy/CpxP family protein refolding chaperone